MSILLNRKIWNDESYFSEIENVVYYIKTEYLKSNQFNLKEISDLDFLSMRAYLLSVFYFENHYWFFETSIFELISCCSEKLSLKQINQIKANKFYKTMMSTLDWLIQNNFIEVKVDIHEIKFKDKFIIKLNPDKFIVQTPYNSNLKDDSQSTGISTNTSYNHFTKIRVIEFKEIFSCEDIPPMKKVRIYFLFLYIKGFSRTYPLHDKKLIYSKVTYSFMHSSLNLSKRTLEAYLKFLDNKVLIIHKINGFVYTDVYGNQNHYGGTNTYIFKFDGYYPGIKNDISRNETMLTNKYLNDNNCERSSCHA